MTKSITNRQLLELRNTLSRMNYTIKNLITRRCEKLAKKLNEEYLVELQEKLDDTDDEFCIKDKDGHSVREELVITDSKGASQRGNTGALKFSSEQDKKRKIALNKLLDEEKVDIPVYVIPLNETNEPLYKKAFELYAYTTLSILSGIILEIPLDEDGFITDEFADKYVVAEKPANKNGVITKEEKVS